MSLLTVVQAVCDEIGFPRPSAVAASTDQLARQAFSLAKAELTQLSKLYEWPVLQREHSFDTVAADASYDLPTDFRALIGHTVFNADEYYQLKGSVSPQEWQYTRSLNLGSLSRAKIRIYGNPRALHITPTPEEAETVVYEYVTKYFAASSLGVEKLTFTADSDESLVDEDLLRMGLKWRLKHAKGLEFSADVAEYNATVKAEYARAIAAPAIQVGGSALGEYPELTEGYVRDNGFGV